MRPSAMAEGPKESGTMTVRVNTKNPNNITYPGTPLQGRQVSPKGRSVHSTYPFHGPCRTPPPPRIVPLLYHVNYYLLVPFTFLNSPPLTLLIHLSPSALSSTETLSIHASYRRMRPCLRDSAPAAEAVSCLTIFYLHVANRPLPVRS